MRNNVREGVILQVMSGIKPNFTVFARITNRLQVFNHEFTNLVDLE